MHVMNTPETPTLYRENLGLPDYVLFFLILAIKLRRGVLKSTHHLNLKEVNDNSRYRTS